MQRSQKPKQHSRDESVATPAPKQTRPTTLDVSKFALLLRGWHEEPPPLAVQVLQGEDSQGQSVQDVGYDD